jgi:hypothetical protein
MLPSEKRVPTRPTVTSFCDRCHALTKVTQYRVAAGKIEWLCDEKCAPNPRQLIRDVVRNDPPPADAVNSPELAQWLDIAVPEDLEEYVPEDLRDEAIEHAYSSAEPIGTEQGDAAHEPEDS